VGRVYGFQTGGVIVGSVVPNGGAAKAGIKPQDILISIDGRHIKDGDDLVDDISSRKVGSSVTIGYKRKGEEHTAVVVIGDRAKVYEDLAGAQPDQDAPAPPDAGQTKLGITVQQVPAAAASKMGIPGGVTVTSVTPGSFAEDIGLGQGDVIVEINKQTVTDVASYNAIVGKLKSGDDVVFVTRLKGQAGPTFLGGTLR
jgi:serine protease Do